jgi:Tfp pilus assembly protein PilN
MIRINLLKPETKEVREAAAAAPVMEFKERRTQPLFGLILVVAVLAIAALFFFQRSAINKEQDLLTKAEQEKQSLQYVVAKLEELQTQRELLSRKIDLIIQLQAEQPSAVIIMDELSKTMPEWVWLTDASYESGVVNVKGRAINNTLLSDYIANLKQSPYFGDVNLISSIRRSIRSDEFHEFSLAIQFLPPSATAATANASYEGEQK